MIFWHNTESEPLQQKGYSTEARGQTIEKQAVQDTRNMDAENVQGHLHNQSVSSFKWTWGLADAELFQESLAPLPSSLPLMF